MRPGGEWLSVRPSTMPGVCRIEFRKTALELDVGLFGNLLLDKGL
jgi:hypothetical protein